MSTDIFIVLCKVDAVFGLDWNGTVQIRPMSVSVCVLRGSGVVVLVRAARWLASKLRRRRLEAVTGREVGEQRRDVSQRRQGDSVLSGGKELACSGALGRRRTQGRRPGLGLREDDGDDYEGRGGEQVTDGRSSEGRRDESALDERCGSGGVGWSVRGRRR